MYTKILKINRENINKEILKEASDLIKMGELVAFPTETVYGLGADGLNSEAVEKIYKAKGRPSDNPLILHISDITMLYNLIESVNQNAKLLIESSWPGPLTLIFKKSDIIPDIITAGGETVAIRLPKDEIARMLIKFSGTPIAAPSANISGRPSPTNASDVLFDLDGKIPLIIDGGDSDIGIESTVVDVSEDIPIILRPGFFTYEYLKDIIPNIILDESLIDMSKVPRSPGQKYKHYSPNAKMEVYIGDNASDMILKKANYYKENNKKVGILTFDDSIDKFSEFFHISFGNRNDLNYMSHILFSSLREMDKEGVDIILAEGVKEIALGKSIMNRMKKSAAGNINYL